MRRYLTTAMAGLVLAVTALPAATLAGTPYQAEATCPVDGKKFNWTSTASYSTWGMELDGKPIGSWVFPMTIPQCPDSRFPVYREFASAEIDAIKALAASPEYAAVQDETSYYLLNFVAGKLGDDMSDADHAWVLLKATWQAREDAARYGRYATETIAAMNAALPAIRSEDADEWLALQVIIANVERQAGLFDAATARLDGLPAPSVEAAEHIAPRIELTRRLIEARETKADSPPRDDD